MDADQIRKHYIAAWTRFNSNVSALYSFFERLTEIADTLDKEKIKRMSIDLAPLFRDTPENIEADLLKNFPSIDDLDFYPSIQDSASVREMIATLQDSKFIEQILDWEQKHPYKSQKFLKILYSALQDPPISGITLRKSMLVMLVTFWEMLVDDLIITYYLSKDETEEQAKEIVHQISNKGWGNRLGELRKINLLSDAQHAQYTNRMIEIAKRRNLIVHNDGVVDMKFIEKATQKYKSLSLGSILVVSTKYFQTAIDAIYSLGFLLCLTAWQSTKMAPKEQSQKFTELIFSSFDYNRYDLVLELTSDLKALKLSPETSQTLQVNRAIAFRELGNKSNVQKIVSNLSQTPHNWTIDIAVAMLNENYIDVESQLKHAAATKDISTINSWPLFNHVRDQPWFKMVFTRRNKTKLNQFNKSRRRH
jgi:hypothetical protein